MSRVFCVPLANEKMSIPNGSRSHGCGSKPGTASEHPNPTTKIGSEIGGAPTPKWHHWL